MGCWNGTCLLSNLPIYAGDEVVFFTLKRRRAKIDAAEDGHCYVDDFYEPLIYPVVGEYDDYGCIENVKEDFSLIEDYFKDVKLTQNKWDKDNDVFRNIERGNYKGYSFALAHKDIYDSLTECAGSREEWWSGGKNVKDFVIQNIEEKYKEHLSNKEHWEKLEGTTDLPAYLIRTTHDVVCGKRSDNHFIAKYFETRDEALRDKLVEMHLMHCVMSSCRKFWFPQTGAGSQDSETELYLILADKMTEKCKQRIKLCESW